LCPTGERSILGYRHSRRCWCPRWGWWHSRGWRSRHSTLILQNIRSKPGRLE
jgi:hypothetical protein